VERRSKHGIHKSVGLSWAFLAIGFFGGLAFQTAFPEINLVENSVTTVGKVIKYLGGGTFIASIIMSYIIPKFLLRRRSQDRRRDD